VSRCPTGTVIIAYGDEDTKRPAIAKGAIGLLTKPLDFTLLREEIDTRLGVCTENFIRVDVARNHLSWRNDRAPMFRRGGLGLTIQVEDPA
jgi:hypothetical protein